MELHGKTFARYWSVAFVVITAVGCLVWQLLCPWCIDDMVYSLARSEEGYSDYTFWHMFGEPYGALREVWDTCAGHVRYTNSRLSNVLFILVQFLPLWGVKFVCGLIVAGMWLGLVALSVPRSLRGRPWLLVLAAVLFWTAFSWNEYMQSSAFVFNYPLPSVAVMAWMYFYRGAAGYGRLGKALLLAGAAVVGFLHELFAVCLGAYVFFDWIVNRRRRSWLAPVAVALLALSVIGMSSFGSGARFRNFYGSTVPFVQYLKWNWLLMLRAYLPALAACAVYAGALAAARRRRLKAGLQSVAPYVLAALCGVGACVVLKAYGRVAWAPSLFASMALMLVAGKFAGPRPSGVSRLTGAVLAGVLAVYSLWLVELCRWQYKSTASTHAVYAAMAPRTSERGHDVVYVDSVFRHRVPFYLMDIPSPMNEVNRDNTSMASEYFTHNRSTTMALVPSKFKGMSLDSLPAVAGNSGMRGEPPFLISDYHYCGQIRITGGRYLPGHNPLSPAAASLKKAVFGGETDIVEPVAWTIPFVAPDSSLKYFMIIPQLPVSFRNREILAVDTLRNQ